MPSYTAYTIYVFALSSFLFGLTTLLNPSRGVEVLDLPAAAAPSVVASSLAAVAMGAFYTLAAYQENRAFFRLSLFTRGLTTSVFWSMGGGWRAPGVWEGMGVVSTAVALALDGMTRPGKRK